MQGNEIRTAPCCQPELGKDRGAKILEKPRGPAGNRSGDGSSRIVGSLRRLRA
jgi:hypothetical protein